MNITVRDDTSAMKKKNTRLQPVLILPFLFAGFALFALTFVLRYQPAPLAIHTEEIAMLSRGWILNATFAGDKIAVAASSGVWLYPIATPDEAPELLGGHTGVVSSVDYHAASNTLVTGSYDNTVRLWNLTTGEVRVLRGHRSDVNDVEISYDGKTVISGSVDKTVRLWDVESGEIRHVLEEHEHIVEDVHFFLDGGKAVSTDRGGQGYVWDVASGRAESSRVKPAVEYLSKELATQLDSWHIHRDEVIRTVTDDDENRLLVVMPQKMVLLDAESLVLIRWFDVIPGAPVNVLAFSPDGKTLVSGGGNVFQPDNRIHLVDVHTHERIRSVKPSPDDGMVMSVAFSDDSRYLAAGTSTGDISIWERDTGRLVTTFAAHEGSVLSLMFSPDGALLASGGADAKIYIRQLADDEIIATLDSPDGPVRTLLLDFEADFSGAGASDTLTTYSVPTSGNEIILMCSHGNDIEGASFSHDGQFRAVSSFSNDIEILAVQDGRILQTLRGHTNRVDDTQFSPDGRLLASGGFDRTIRLWDVQRGEMLYMEEAHLRPVTQVAFSPDGTLLASASEDGSVKLWRLINTP